MHLNATDPASAFEHLDHLKHELLFSNISIYGWYFTCSFNVMILTKTTSLPLFLVHEHDNVKMIKKYLKSILKYL